VLGIAAASCAASTETPEVSASAAQGDRGRVDDAVAVLVAGDPKLWEDQLWEFEASLFVGGPPIVVLTFLGKVPSICAVLEAAADLPFRRMALDGCRTFETRNQ